MRFEFQLQPSDLAEASELVSGGRFAALKTYGAWATFVGAISGLLSAGWTGQWVLSLGVGVALSAIYVLWGWRDWMRRIRSQFSGELPAWLLEPRSLTLDDRGVESSGASQRSFHAWSLIQFAHIGHAVVALMTESGIMLVLPARAVPSRAELVALLRSRLGQRMSVRGCPRCGYDTSRSRQICPECGLKPNADGGTAA